MTKAVLVEIADDVVTHLNADLSWSQDFEAARAPIDFEDELEDDGLHVDVAIGRLAEGEAFSRADQQGTYDIDVAVRKKCNVSDLSVTDPLWLLLQEIRDNFLEQRLPNYTEAYCVGWASKPTYFRSHARKFRQFTGVITLKFQIVREL